MTMRLWALCCRESTSVSVKSLAKQELKMPSSSSESRCSAVTAHAYRVRRRRRDRMFGRLGALIVLAAFIGACTPCRNAPPNGWKREVRQLGNKVTIDVYTR